MTGLVSGEWLQDHLNDPNVVLLEVSMNEPATASYFSGHAPGGHYLFWKDFTWHDSDRDFATPEVMAQRLEAYGVTDESTVVLIGDAVQFGTYAYWAMTMAGLEHLAVVLDGGAQKWISGGFPTTLDQPTPPPPGRVTPGVTNHESRVGRDDVLARLKDPGRLLVDVRSPEEYSGERVAPSTAPFDHGAQRNGRIPGAKHLYYLDHLLNEDMTFRSAEEMVNEFKQIGSDQTSEVVTYCRLSHRASLAWFALTRLADQTDVKVYDGSWTEWGSLVGFPVER